MSPIDPTVSFHKCCANCKSVFELVDVGAMKNVKILLFLAAIAISKDVYAGPDLSTVINKINQAQKPKIEIIFTENTEKDGINSLNADKKNREVIIAEEERREAEREEKHKRLEKENNDRLCREADGIVNGICYKLIPQGKNEYKVECGNIQTSTVYYSTSSGEWCNGLIASICNKDLKSVVKFICSK